MIQQNRTKLLIPALGSLLAPRSSEEEIHICSPPGNDTTNIHLDKFCLLKTKPS